MGSDSQNKKNISLIIPTKNESKNLPYVIPKIPDIVDEIILVDGNSSDDTIKNALKLNSKIKVVKQKSHGKGQAIIEGFRESKGEILIMIDADGSMDPKEIPTFIKKIESGYDLVKGSRFLKGGYTEDMTIFRKLGNFFFVSLVNLLFKEKYTDLCYGFMCMSRKLYESIDLNSDGFSIETEIILKASLKKFKITEVPSYERKRIHGKSNLKAFRDGFIILKRILSEWLNSKFEKKELRKSQDRNIKNNMKQ